MDSRHSSLGAIGFMLMAVAFFSLMDASMKALSLHYPSLQVTTLRGAASLPFVLAWVWGSAGLRSIAPARWSLHLLRGVLGIVMIACFAQALKSLPLATGYAIFFVAPLLITALSVPILKEKVGPRRWAAIGGGLVGVLVVLRPGIDGFISIAGLLVLAAATAYAGGAITVRLLVGTDTSQAMVVWFLLLMAIGAGVMAAPGWVPLRWEHAWLIAVMGLTGALGQMGLTTAFQRGEASLIAPLEYTGLVWVIAWDWAFWRVLPDWATWLGAGIIIASGLYLLHRESVQRRRSPG
ncbi:MAG: DMT family transporter [Xanthomonadaceae bacterium]|jgi:drug/metabolite transporter (DMT)-like permease|nr:DMT family transporter [Xanthomonadaceae bacterium]